LISCHLSGLAGRRCQVDGSHCLSKRFALDSALSARRSSSISASEALESSFPSKSIGLSILCQKNRPSISTTEVVGSSPRLPLELSPGTDLPEIEFEKAFYEELADRLLEMGDAGRCPSGWDEKP
jgi:hypothetical protein